MRQRWKPLKRAPRIAYEIAVLKALEELGGAGAKKSVCRRVEILMKEYLDQHPEEREHYDGQNEPIWETQACFAREDLKRKGQLNGSQHGIWKITQKGRERLQSLRASGIDPDEPAPPILEEEPV
jgi:hypothetical protein